MFRLVQGDGTLGSVAVCVYFLRALQSGVGILPTLALGVLDRDGRRLVMKLRFDSLWSGRAAIRVGRGALDLSLELRDLRCARAAMSGVTVTEQRCSCSNDQPAKEGPPPNRLAR